MSHVRQICDWPSGTCASSRFACVAMLTLALGLGANTMVFTLVHALMLLVAAGRTAARAASPRRHDGLLCEFWAPHQLFAFSFRLFEHLRANAPEFAELAGFQANTTTLGVRRSGELVSTSLPAAFVTGNYFTMFGVTPAAGRLLRAEDDRPDAPPAVVMSHRAWTQHFGQDPSVVGGAFVIGGTPMTVVGVAAEQFFGDTIRPDPAAIWIPMGQEPRLRGTVSLIGRADQHWLYAIGRITSPIPPAQISARLTTVLQQWLSAQPFVPDGARPLIPRQHIVVVPADGGVSSAQAQYGRSLNLLFAASAMVLLIAIANLANLLLARVDRGQAAIRAALGASSGRLIRQALTEGILIAVAGGLVGVGVAAIGTHALIKVVFPMVAFVPVESAPAPGRLFALALAVVTARSSAPHLRGQCRERRRSMRCRASVAACMADRSPRGSLLVVQVALSLVLLRARVSCHEPGESRTAAA
jgi:predicted permease